jgi:predicted metal-dependent enzyme (double-stranded beta helix superfamily)
MAYAYDLRHLEQLYRWLPNLAFNQSCAFLGQITSDPVFVVTHIVPALSQVASGQEPTIVASYGAREASTCLQVFTWPAGATTAIHDHTSWGAYLCVVGTLMEERYVRLDDGAQPSRACLRKVWQRAWLPDDGASTVGAYEDGIHRISNPGSRPAISLHLYGPRVGVFDGRDYDPQRDFVCDRRELDETTAHSSPWRAHLSLSQPYAK